MRKILSVLLLLGVANVVVASEIKDRKETSLIIIHHSATESGNAEIFRRYHKEEKGWDDIGYHFVITNGNGGIDGKIEKGRPIQKQGAHAKNRNHNSVGICLVGTDEFTEKQRIATTLLIAKLCLKYDIEPSEKTIQKHHKYCPGSGFNFQKVIEEAKLLLDMAKEILKLNSMQKCVEFFNYDLEEFSNNL